MNKHLQKIKRREHRFDENSFFEITLNSGEIINENDYRFIDFSTEKLVKYRDSNKIVKLCNLPAVSIKVKHHNLKHEMKIPKDCQMYQCIRSYSEITNGNVKSEIIGRVIGLVKNGEVIQEIYLDGQLNEVFGFCKKII